MSIQLNMGDHTSRVDFLRAFPFAHQPAMRWARNHLKVIASTKPSANVYFLALPGKRSLSRLLNDRSIWVNYLDWATDFGVTYMGEGYTEIGISDYALRRGRVFVAAILAHELAHVNGAEGKPSMAAENALVACGFGTKAELQSGIDDPSTPYDPSRAG